MSNWLKNLREELKEKEKQQIIQLYLECLTYEQISEKIGVSVGKSLIFSQNSNLNFLKILLSLTVCSCSTFGILPAVTKTKGLDFKGVIPAQLIENLLYYYTEPMSDIVVDPMAGSGTTIDVCRAMYRRYRAYDKKPIREDTKQWDINKGFPPETKNCDFIFLDPPYFNMVFKDFTSIEDFYEFIGRLAENSFRTIRKGGKVTLLM